MVPKVSGRPGALRRPRGRIQPVSSSTSSVPLDGDHAADFLDLGARDRLMIGDDGERLDRRARQLPRLGGFPGHQPRQIAGGAERPFVGDAHQIDAARGVFRLQLRQRDLDVDAVGHPLGQRRLVERLGRGKQQRFEQPQFFRPRLRIYRVLLDSSMRFSARLAMARSPSSTYSAGRSGADIAPELIAANAFENTAARTPLSGSTPSRLPAPFPARQQN